MYTVEFIELPTNHSIPVVVRDSLYVARFSQQLHYLSVYAYSNVFQCSVREAGLSTSI